MIGGAPARTPANTIIYAVGDVHGRLDLLDLLHERIVEDARDHARDRRKVVVYLGDFVDRGLNSAGVIDRLIEQPLNGFEAFHLIGNHDAWLLGFLEDVSIGPSWLRHGGDATLLSYGISPLVQLNDFEALEAVQQRLRSRMPDAHLDFLESLELCLEFGD
ncbi:MAG: metallophosphoesterase [Geminicoccaceae bacterium]